MTEKKMYRATYASTNTRLSFRIVFPETLKASNIKEARKKARNIAYNKNCKLVEVIEIEA